MAEKKKTEKSADKKEDVKKEFQAVQDSLHKIWLAGLGALSRAEEEGSKLFKTLVEKGEDYEQKTRVQLEGVMSKVEAGAGAARDRAESTWTKVEGKVDELVTAALRRTGIPSREEIATLTQRVEELTRVVEGLKKAPAKKAAAE